MKNILSLVAFVLAFSIAALIVLNSNTDTAVEENRTPSAQDYKDATYTMVDGTSVTLLDGVAEKVLENGMATTVKTRYFGNELFKDLNDDGREDVVFLLTQDMGGSGTYFFVVASLNTENGYVGSHALLLGDRIAPQTTESGPGKQVIVNYAERATGEPMTTSPSVGTSLRLVLDLESMQFVEVDSEFKD